MIRTLTKFTTLSLIAAALAGPAAAQVVAGPVSNPANGHRYWVIRIANYEDYRIASQNLGGYPVLINDAAENTWVWNTIMPLVPSDRDYAYIGLTDRGVEGEYEAMIDARVLYTNWNSGEPNNGFGSNEDFISMRRQLGNWNDLPAPVAGEPLPYAIVEAPAANGTGLPAGVQYGPIIDEQTGRTYYVLTPARWNDARVMAESLGGFLAVINNVAEQQFVTRHILRLSGLTTQVYIGLNDAASEGQWRWANNDPSTYRRWAAGEPNNGGGNEDYGTIFATQGAANFGFWNDNADVSFNALVEVVPCEADFNQDGFVDFFDFNDFAEAFDRGC